MHESQGFRVRSGVKPRSFLNPVQALNQSLTPIGKVMDDYSTTETNESNLTSTHPLSSDQSHTETCQGVILDRGHVAEARRNLVLCGTKSQRKDCCLLLLG